jgi:hypothetical protein
MGKNLTQKMRMAHGVVSRHKGAHLPPKHADRWRKIEERRRERAEAKQQERQQSRIAAAVGKASAGQA